MKKMWLNRVLGESSEPEQPAKGPSTILKQVIGEDSLPDTEGEAPPPAESEHPADVIAPEAEPGGADEMVEPVQALVSLWTSGGKMDVAVKLLTEPVSYTDFVRLVQAIGNEGALELGQTLDSMEQGAEEEPADTILSRVSDIRNQRGGGEEEDRDFRERHAAGDPTAIAAGEQ